MHIQRLCRHCYKRDKIVVLNTYETDMDTCSHICWAAGTEEITQRFKKKKKKNYDSPSLISAHLKSFSVCRMLWGICVNELHHSCEMMAQLGKQKCKVWQFKWMCFVSVCKQHLRDSMHKSRLIKTLQGVLEVGILGDRFLPHYSAP